MEEEAAKATRCVIFVCALVMPACAHGLQLRRGSVILTGISCWAVENTDLCEMSFAVSPS